VTFLSFAKIRDWINGIGPTAWLINEIIALAMLAIGAVKWLVAPMLRRFGVLKQPNDGVSLYRLKDLMRGPTVRKVLSDKLLYEISRKDGGIVSGPYCPKCKEGALRKKERHILSNDGERIYFLWICRFCGREISCTQPPL